MWPDTGASTSILGTYILLSMRATPAAATTGSEVTRHAEENQCTACRHLRAEQIYRRHRDLVMPLKRSKLPLQGRGCAFSVNRCATRLYSKAVHRQGDAVAERIHVYLIYMGTDGRQSEQSPARGSELFLVSNAVDDRT